MKTIPPSRPPEILLLLRLLRDASVDFVLHGSVAAMMYGVSVEPGDLDVTPSLKEANLKRLSSLLIDIEAVPEGFGHWETRPDGERRWVDAKASPAERLRWQPDIDDLATLDHLFLTRHGNLDIVPELVGAYSELMRRAEQIEWRGVTVPVAHVNDLLARMTVARREKDVSRVAELREYQRAGPRSASRTFAR